MLIRVRSFSLSWLFISFSIFACSSLSAQETSLDQQQLSACGYPDLPVIVDGSNTNKSAMSAMHQQVSEFVVSIEGSLECLDKAANQATPENAEIINQLYNNGVDQLNFIATQYNEQVRLYNRYQQVLDNSMILQNPYNH